MDIATIKQRVKEAGGQSLLALRMQVSPAAVKQWLNGVRPIPVDRMADFEKALNGAVSRREMCADWARIWPEMLADDWAPLRWQEPEPAAETASA